MSGSVRSDIDASVTALFILAAVEGWMSIPKHAQSRRLLLQCGNGLFAYLNGLATPSRDEPLRCSAPSQSTVFLMPKSIRQARPDGFEDLGKLFQFRTR